MSGIAEILHNWGFTVTGSDLNKTDITDKLNDNGILVSIGHDLKNVHNSDLVVYTAAVKQNNPELCEAKNLKIPTIERGDFLGIITKSYLNSIGISGTHGKTTTTSMVSLCFLEENLDPTIQVGAILKQLNGNYRVGNSDYLIIESCEYAESFLNFHLKSAIILNIDNDHLDYFKTFENLKHSFEKYVAKLPANGFLVLNADDENCLELKNKSKAKIITYGINNNADFTAKNIEFDSNGFAKFDVYYKNEFFNTIKLSVPGIHNVSNALACISLCFSYGISKESIAKALLEFTGAHRRFEFMGKYNNASIFDDYGHHPAEILATVNGLKNIKHNNSWVVFQPHTYSRTKNLLEDFAKVLINFDNIIITDIYAAREENIYNISSHDLVDRIVTLGKKAVFISDFNEIANYLKSHIQPNDIVLTLGAGPIDKVSKILTT